MNLYVVSDNILLFVFWWWAAGGTASANSDGTITSQVSANTDYGFSIVTYTGSAGGTVGHGLGAAPKIIIAKSRTQAKTWPVYTEATGKDKYLNFPGSDAAQTSSGVWGSSAPTSTVFGIENSSTGGNVHGDIVAYCWTEISGYSKISSYSGSGASGNKQTTGFKPRWVLIKGTDSAYNWQLFDSERNPANPRNGRLELNNTSQEATTGNNVNFLDDGFDFNTNSDKLNGSSKSYIYMAFADLPGNHWNVNNIVTNEGLTTSKTQFDVVTYTGNGGTQAIGQPVYSNETTGGNNTSNMFDGSGSSWNNLTAGNTITFTPSRAIACTQLEIWLDEAFNSFENAPADLLFMKCKLLWRYKKYEETSNLLADIKIETISEIRKQDFLQLKAKHFEKFKKFDKAFACFTQSNLMVKESKEYPKHNPEQYFQNLRDSLYKLKSSSRIKLSLIHI